MSESNITAGQIHAALVASIEERWKPIAAGILQANVPHCQLCKVLNVYAYHERPDSNNCEICPLTLVGDWCGEEGKNGSKRSSWKLFVDAKNTWDRDDMRLAAQNMVNVLQGCLDKFFPAGLDEVK